MADEERMEGRSHAAVFAKAYAGIVGDADVSRPWGQDYKGLAVVQSDLSHGKLWRFGTAGKTATIDCPLGAVVGRPFLPEGQQSVSAKTEEDVRRFLPDMDGRFSFFLECGDGRLVLATDWLGLGPLFVGELNGSVYFASHLGLLTQLLDSLPPLDQLGVASMLGGSTLIGGRTIHQGIRRLMAGELAVVSVGDRVRLSVEKYVEPVEILLRTGHPASDPLEEFDHHIRSAMERENLASDDSVLMLSGGKDSTALAYALVENGQCEMLAATFGRRYCSDMVEARKTTRDLGLTHRQIPYADWTLHGEADFVADISGGSSGLQTSHNIVGFQHMRSQVNTVIVGFLGGAISGYHLNLPCADRLALSLAWGWRAPFEDIYREELRILRDELTRQFDEMEGLARHQKILLSDFMVRQATWISQTFSLCGWWTDISTPFCHRGLISFLFNLPEAELAKQSLYTRWLDMKAARLRRRRMSLAVSAAELEREVRLSMSWRFGAPSPNSTVDWKRMLKASGNWLEQTIDRFDGDGRLRTLARDDLSARRADSYAGNPLPLLFAGSIMLARQ